MTHDTGTRNINKILSMDNVANLSRSPGYFKSGDLYISNILDLQIFFWSLDRMVHMFCPAPAPVPACGVAISAARWRYFEFRSDVMEC